MNGRLVVECRAGKVVLRLRYYPIWLAIGTSGLMALIARWMLHRSSDSGFNHLVLFLAVLLPTVFIGIAVYLEKQPPLLVHDLATRSLSVPREPLHLSTLPKAPVGVGDIHFRIGSKRIHGQALYITPSSSAHSIPIFVDHFPKRLALSLEKFAQLAGYPVFQAPSITIA